jgi:hypothetical protein
MLHCNFNLLICVLVIVSSLWASTSERTSHYHVGLCITGQLQRLELNSKIENVLRHGIKKGYKYDTVLVLDSHLTGDPVYVNGYGLFGAYKTEDTDYDNIIALIQQYSNRMVSNLVNISNGIITTNT